MARNRRLTTVVEQRGEWLEENEAGLTDKESELVRRHALRLKGSLDSLTTVY